MNVQQVLVGAGILFVLGAARLSADQVELQNGDRISGQVLSVSANAVVLQSETLGRITLPRARVARLAFGTNSIAPVAANPAPAVTNLPPVPNLATLLKTNAAAAVVPRGLTGDTNVIRQIRDQMLAGSPAAAAKYDEMVNGLLTGTLDMNELRREAKSSADQLRQLKRELGPDAGDSLDAYLEVLDQFLQESATQPAAPHPPQNPPAP